MALGTVPLGRTGLRVSELALGTWRFGHFAGDGSHEIDRETAFDLLDTYAAAGGTFIDTADTYGDGCAENWVGDWLAGRDRERFLVASKVFWSTREGNPNFQGLNRTHLRRQLRRSLERLGTDYLDVLYVTRWWDETPAPQFLRTLDALVEDGLVHHLGISSIQPHAWRVVKANEYAHRNGLEPFGVTQPRYTLVNRAPAYGYLDMCRDYGLAVCPWSPLAGGFLSGKYRRGEDPPAGSRAAREPEVATAYLTDENFAVLEEVRAVADEVGATPAQVSLAWLLAEEVVTSPVVGARTVEQLEENLGAVDVELTDEQIELLEEASDRG